MRAHFQAGEVAKMAGMTPRLLSSWCASGVLKPRSAGRSTDHRRCMAYELNLQQVIAAAYGHALRKHLRCGTDWVEAAVRFVAESDPLWLEEQLAVGPVAVMPLGGCLTRLVPLTLPPDASPAARRLAAHADLAACWRRVEREAEGLGAKPKKTWGKAGKRRVAAK